MRWYQWIGLSLVALTILLLVLGSPSILRQGPDTAANSVAPDTGLRILLIGLDGADWQIAEPLIESGRMPNLARLRARAAWGNIRTLTPALSPLLWTSVATGVTADRHGILDFLARDPETGEEVPVTSRFRKVRALWNIFGEFGRTTDIVAWWATWPAETVRGHMISDRVSYSLFDFEIPSGGAGATYPPDYLDTIRPLLVDGSSIMYEETARFADITSAEFDAARARAAADQDAAYREPINHLTEILAATRNYHRIALDLIEKGQADLTAVYYQGIDEVGHRFMHFTPPRLEGIDPADVHRYGNVVKRFYEYQDRLLGELLEAAHPDTVVVLLSDHGFINGPDRPAGTTADIEGRPGFWHRRFGMLALAGPPIRPIELDTTSLLDIAPTVLYLAGLPVPDDAEGTLLVESVKEEFLERWPPVRIATYEITPFSIDAAPMTASMSEAEQEMMANLRSLGYIGDVAGTDPDPATQEAEIGTLDTVTGHSNLASVHLSTGALQEAERELLAALSLQPKFRAARRLLFDLRMRQERYDEAIEIAEELISEGDGVSPVFLTGVAEAYRLAGLEAEGIDRFREGFERGEWDLGVPLARLQMEAGDIGAAEKTSRELLKRDPLNEPAMAILFRVLGSSQRLESVEPLIDEAIGLNPRSVMHLNWKAVIHESRGEVAEADELLRLALDANPDHGGSMANLGAFYVRHGRAEEAAVLLERALVIEPDNLEARVNLGSAMAIQGRMEGAIAQFEEAVARGVTSTAVYNALARAHAKSGDRSSAVLWLKRSLELDPRQPRIRSALASLDR